MEEKDLVKLVNVAAEFISKKAPNHHFIIISWGPAGKASVDNLPEGQDLGSALATIGYEMQSNSLGKR